MDAKGCSATITSSLTNPPLITLDFQSQDLNCFEDASGMVSVTTGNTSGGLIYNWTGPNGFSTNVAEPADLVAGEYCVTITDGNNCEVNDCVVLMEPMAMMLTTSSTSVDCFNTSTGTATVLAAGGAGGFQYAWNDPCLLYTSPSPRD